MKDEIIEHSVDSYIKRILPQAGRELKYIKDNDWSEIANVKSRENSYKIQKLLNDRNVKSAVKLYKISGEEELGSKRIKAALKKLMEFFYILEDRYNKTIKNFDWTSFDISDDSVAKKVESEIQMQATILDDLNSLESQLKSINFGDIDDSVSISMHGEESMPFMMAESLQKAFPEIETALNKKKK